MNTVKTKAFSNFLKRIYLNGTISDCVIDIKKKSFFVEAVDPTNTLIVINKTMLLNSPLKESIGISNINIIIKFLSTLNEPKINFEVEEYKLLLSRKDKRRKLNFILSDTETIPTTLMKDDTEEDTKQLLIDMQQYRITLDESIISDFLSYIGLSESKDIELKLETDGGEHTAQITIGSNISHQFNLTVSPNNIESLKKKSKNISLLINGEFLAKIFSVIDFNKEDKPVLYIAANENPIVIIENNTLWSIAPMILRSRLDSRLDRRRR